MTTTANQKTSRESRSRWIWGGLIVGLLTLQVVMSLSAAYLAMSTSNAAAPIIDDFHQQGLDWDQYKEKQAESDQLQWTLVTSIGLQEPAPSQFRNLQLVLRDHENKPVFGGTGELLLFHHADANNKQQVPVIEDPPNSGVYNATVIMQKAGLWQIDLVILAREKTFLHSEVHEKD